MHLTHAKENGHFSYCLCMCVNATQNVCIIDAVQGFITCRTRCLLKMCFTQRTTYSVSLSVNSTALSLDLNSGPRSANSGMAASCSGEGVRVIGSCDYHMTGRVILTCIDVLF